MRKWVRSWVWALTLAAVLLWGGCLSRAAEVMLTARKTWEGKPPGDGACSFRLLSEAGAVVEEAGNCGETVYFSPLQFDREGIYRYYLKEVPVQGREAFCDRTVYTVTVEVKEDLTSEVHVLRNGEPWSQTPVFAACRENPGTGDGILTAFTVLVFTSAALGILAAFGKV